VPSQDAIIVLGSGGAVYGNTLSSAKEKRSFEGTAGDTTKK